VGGTTAGYFGILRRATWPLLIFEATVGLALLFVFDPLLALLTEQLVALSGDPYVGNMALAAFVLSPLGALALATAATGTILVNVLALGGVSVILWDARLGLRTSQPRIWGALLRRLPALVALSACAFAALLLLALPVAAAAFLARRGLLSDGDFYFYLATRPPTFLWAIALVATVAAAAAGGGLLLLLRLFLALPACLLHPLSTQAGLRLALAATAGRARWMLPRLLGVAAALAVLWGATLLALSVVLAWLTAWPLTSPWLGPAAIGFAAAAALVFAVLAALFRAGLVLVLIADPSAGQVLSGSAVPEAAPRAAGRLRLAAGLLVCLAVPALAALQTVRAGRAALLDHPVSITAHRAGSADAPENTLAALDNAIAAGADAVEVDAQETADGAVVLLHDTDLRRVAGVARPIWDMRLAEVQALDAGSWFAPAFAAERVPTLRAFAIAGRGRIGLNVEIKNNGHGADLAARTAAVLEETGTAGTAVISSLDPGLLREARRAAPQIGVGLILATGVGNFRRADVAFFALARRLATPAVIRALHGSGRAVHVWTLDDEAAIAGAMLDGADDIITGNPRLGVRVRAWFDGLNPPERFLLTISHRLGAAWLRRSLAPHAPENAGEP